MTRKETLLTLIKQAHANGFDFRLWFQTNILLDWPGTEEAISLLSSQGRWYSLVFSHDFAQALWKKGAQMNFVVPSITFSRMNGKGEVVTVNRKPFTRRTIRPDVWQWHLQKLATYNDPILYLERFLSPAESVFSKK